MDDIPRLVEHFLRVLPLAAGRSLRVDPAIYGCLKSYSWPGNVRELRNVIERAIILAEDGLISGQGPSSGNSLLQRSLSSRFSGLRS